MTNPANSSYLVIRLVPESPVDGGTFSTYLDDLKMVVQDANTGTTISNAVYVSPLTLVESPPGSGTYMATASQVTSADTGYNSTSNYGDTLQFGTTDGISVGASVYTADGTTIDGSYTVKAISPTTPPTVTLDKVLTNFVPAGTVVSFISLLGQNGAGKIDTTQQPPVVTLTCDPSSGTPAGGPTTLRFPSGKTKGIPVGTVLSPVTGLVAANTTVTGATATRLYLSVALLGPLPAHPSLMLSFSLSEGIAQHTEQTPDGWFFGTLYKTIPAAAATALVQLKQAPPSYLDITIAATRGTEQILDSTVYYNVKVQSGSLPSMPGMYQAIPATDTSLYFFLPPPPTLNSAIIALETSGDGTPPQFEELYPAIISALGNDQITTGNPAVNVTPAMLIDSATWCRRIAYDIVWSYQNTLPPLPDPLESLYTNPPNPGGGGSTTAGSNSGDTNNFEMDRQKFEGSLNSFYSTRNAAAERLTKFVAAASAALACEQYSLAATSALLEFPVDPLGKTASGQDVTLSTAVESEVLLTGLGTGGAAGIWFGVPAAFFYALSTSLDKTTSATQRFQLATGDSIDRLLQLFTAAQDAELLVVGQPQPFSANVPNPPPGITPFQAARRLAALGVSAASNSPQAPVTASPPASGPTPLADIVSAWLSETDPSGTQTPPPAYQQNDFAIWQGLATSQPTGYLDLDLDALTQGYSVSSTATLADEIAAWLPTLPGAASPPTVETLKGVTPAQWTGFFTSNPQWLPPFTQPAAGTSAGQTQAGYIATRIRAWIRAVQRFFTISSAPTASSINPPGAIPDFALPAYDPITQAAEGISATFTFGKGQLTATALTAAAQGVFPGDQPAQDWLVQAMTTIDQLYEIASTAPPLPASSLTSYTPSFPFSVMEALYARGFLTAADVVALSPADFQLAMTGTVGYDSADTLYEQAQRMASAPPAGSQPGTGFVPINSDGSLVDCVPPPCLSPTGPIAYLKAMLAAAPTSTAPTLGTVLSQRRGPVGSLTASAANLETPLPLIDLVNECLEYLAANTAPGGTTAAVSGTVYDTTTAGDDDLAEMLEAVSQHSTPATPDAANGAVEPAAFNKLKDDFSACVLPYSQALDVSRTYLGQLGSSRFEEIRTFRRYITEFVLDPAQEPGGFESWLWRYPVRADTAIEYLGITPEEYATLFQGTASVGTASQGMDGTDTAPVVPPRGTITLPVFLAQTCLTYCEFYELWESGFVSFRAGSDDKGDGDGTFPECEPCCPEQVWLQFPEQRQEQDLLELVIFVRLWRKLREHCDGYSFAQLRDICNVLKLEANGAPNPNFVRQLAAFQMLHDEFRLDLTDPAVPVPPGAVDAERGQLLALWTEPQATGWPWAVRQLLAKIEEHAQRRPSCSSRSPEFVKLLLANLDPLSRLAGFDPDSPTDSWHALPTHTLRFAEVLSKVYASPFSVGELIFLFTTGPQLDGDAPFPLQGENQALDDPLGLPADDSERDLRRLRAEMLAAEAADAEGDDAAVDEWPWRRIESALQTEFRFAAADVTALGQHFFPRELARAGQAAPPSSRYFVSPLAAASTSAPMWNNPPDGPFRYDPAAGQLSASVPLTDRAVLDKLAGVHDLNADERRAVQDLFFAPRAMLADFALLFADFAHAQRVMIEEQDETLRFAYFRRQFLLCRRRAHLIAIHLARHVAAVTGQEGPDHDAAALILRTLAGDENLARGSWEDDSGASPGLTWPLPGGSALAALLGLAGTGLTAEYRAEGGPGGPVVWRDLSAGLGGFGHERDRENCPVPTVLPALDATVTPQQTRYASVHNGLLMRFEPEALLGGAQGFSVTWSGTLLIEREGTYEFWAGAPTQGEDCPDAEAAGQRRWRVVLRRGQRTWVILSHHWDGTEELPAASLPLKRGAYKLTAEFVQPAPEFRGEDDARPLCTGFQVKYRGPDSDGRRVEIPRRALFATRKDQPLGDGINEPGPRATAYLGGLYASSLRDIRRSYQRAFKALLFCHRLGLSARPQPHGTSELGYLLAQPQLFAGSGYYRSGGGFTRHTANFDVDFLPLEDDYYPPAPGTDARTDPSPQRIQAMFDWWERLYDYTVIRADVRRADVRPLWHLFEEALDKQPADPGFLLRHVDADARHWPLELRYFQGQNSPVYEVTSADLCDDRWTVRAWHAGRWLRAARRRFAAPDIEAARPDLWASEDPSAVLPGETQAGNASLLAYVAGGCLADGEPRRYDDLRLLNDGLRERGRRALIAYLCQQDRVPLPWQPGQFARTPGDLSGLLLLDVEAGLREKASRIEEACSAAQAFVHRSRLGLEPDWPVTGEFARQWETRFGTYHTWARARNRELYRESWIEWDEFAKARRVDAFRFLETRLRAATLTVAAPGGMDWWADDDKGLEHAPELLQRRVPSRIRALQPPLVLPPQQSESAQQQAQSSGQPAPTTREGFTVLGHPEWAGQPAWLATAAQPSTSGQGDGTVQSLAAAAVDGSAAPTLPLWMQAAAKLGTRFIRVAAAGIPEAASRFVPRPGPFGAEVDEYYFWLIPAQVYTACADKNASAVDDSTFTGTYQFGFQDSYYDEVQQQSAEWDDDTQVPKLLASWLPGQAVRLAWCRVHNGEFGQPRRSDKCVPVDGQPDLLFLGRAWDSLHFEVIQQEAGNPPPAPEPSGFGFRYDLVTDEAAVLPEVVPAPAPATKYPGGLDSYPFFAYERPGARLFPASWFATSVTVAGALRARCGYDLALRWYRRAFDPQHRDCTWVHCPAGNGTGGDGNGGADGTPAAPTQDEITQRAREIWELHGEPSDEAAQDWQQAIAELQAEAAANGDATSGRPPGACCDASEVTAQGARDRAVTLHYCRTLVEWGDALMRRGHSPEAFQQARVLYETAARITGRRPRTIPLPKPATTATVTAFVPAYAPLNPQLMDIYDLVADRLGLIRRSLDERRIRNGRPDRDMPYFGDACDVTGEVPDEENWCAPASPYRFLSQIQKALELAGRVRELGAALLSAYEKGDAEYLAALRAEQEREMLALGIAIRQDQWRDADWQVQALQQTKDVNQANLLYYAGLYQGGLLNNETQNLDLTTTALASRTGANLIETVGEIMNIIPDPFVGAMSSGASVPAGTKLAHLFEAIGRIMQTVADIMSTTAAMDLTLAGWQRRAAEWLHQTQTLPIEIEQIELQILGAHRRRDQALRELNNQQRQVEHATEVLDFLRDKFTATDLYLWLQQETAGLYRQMYELALRAAREAERSFNFELRRGVQRFLPAEPWDNLHAGLLAGERLDLALHRMEEAYLDQNRRELELTEHFSLRLDFPLAYLRLRATGHCEIDIAEWMFNRHYPSHYMLRLAAVSATVPVVTSQLTGVHAKLTLLSSMTRISPEVRPPAQHCCRDCRRRSEYEPCADDPRVVREYAARESIATSSGQNDSGLFELSFRDERLLPNQFRGAVSRWRIELPPENNYFDLDTLTDFVLHINYTAREGGPALAEAAGREAHRHLPGDGLRVFDVRHDFPDAWPGLRGHGARQLRLGFIPSMFPFVPGHPERIIDRLLLMFAAPDAASGRHHLVRFWLETDGRDTAVEIECVAEEGWPGYFRGTVDLRRHPLGPLRDERPSACGFEFPAQAGRIRSVFVLASYDVIRHEAANGCGRGD